MTIAIIVCVMAGIAIGFRFKIFMAVPAILGAALVTTMIAVAQGESNWAIFSAAALSALGTQAGYLCGSFAASLREAPIHNTAPGPSEPVELYRSHATMAVKLSDR